MEQSDSPPNAGPPTVVFVTGGTGFIGSHLVEALLARGMEVRCLVRSELKWLEGLPVRVIQGDLDDDEALRCGVAGAEYVFHVAGVTRARDWATFERANVTATLRLLDLVAEHAPDIKRVLITSSLAAVGPCTTGLEATEADPMQPVSPYGRSKAEMETRIAEHGRGVPVTIVRPPSVYGPREADIFTFFQSVNRGLCPVVGDADRPELSLVHVRDLVRGMIEAAESDAAVGETYFVSSERPYAWSEVKRVTCAALGRSALTLPVPVALVGVVGLLSEWAGKLTGTYPPLNRDKAREIRYTCKAGSPAKAMRDFGYRQQVSLEEGIAETIAWYRQAGWM
ncbi:MAG: NAD-dependent epimerase/dehydratase family protein [Bacteroidota bacterium]